MAVSKVEINRNGTTETLIDLTADTVSEDKVLQGYTFHKANGESAVGTASGGGGSSTKYGVSMDSILGDIDSDGVLQAPSEYSDLVCNATAIGVNALDYGFYQNDKVKTVSFPAVETIGNSGLSYAFYGCTGLTSIDLSSLASVGSSGLYNAFRDCRGLTSVDLSNLNSVGQYGLNYTFRGCTGLTGSVSFPALTTDGVSITGTSSSNNPFYRCFYQCTGITELHFPSAFSAYSSYLTKTVLFGGTSTSYCNANLQILFDL